MHWLALAVALAWAASYVMKPKTLAAELPTDTQGRRARVRKAIGDANLGDDLEKADRQHGGKVRAAFYNQGQLETADFTSPAFHKTNSLSNRHVGRGLGDWLRETHVTPSGEPLRVYASLEQSIEDLAQNLLKDPLYKDAKAALMRGDVKGYNHAVAQGNGKVGFVGPANTDHARTYTASLNAIYDRSPV